MIPLLKKAGLFLRMDRTSFLLIAVLLSLLGLRERALRQPSADESGFPLRLVRAIFDDASELRPEEETGGFLVVDEGGTVVGRVVSTSPMADSITGYAGPVPLIIGFGLDGRIRGVELLPNMETESFVAYIREEGLLGRWNGLDAPSAVAKEVDAVSGATMTSSAMIASLRVALADEANGAVVVSRDTPGWPARLGWGCAWLAVAGALAAFLFPKPLRRYRYAAQAYNVAVLGVWTGTMVSLSVGYGWLVNGIGWTGWVVLACLGGLAVLLPLLTGRSFYCVHVCPYGAAQDLAALAWRWRRPRLPRFIGWFLRLVRGSVLCGLFLAFMWGVSFDVVHLEPFAAFQFRSAGLSVLVLAGAFLVISVVFPRLWCRFLCPTGFLLRVCRAVPVGRPVPAGRGWLRFSALCLALAGCAIVILRPAGPMGVSAGTPPSEREEHAADGPRDVLSVIHSRKSVRHYRPRSLSRETLETLVRAGMAAPTAGNAQPWAFVVVTERSRLDRIAEGLEYGKMLYQAPAAIVVCGVPEKGLKGGANAFWVQDCSAATENILLAAEGIGLGAVWVGCYPFEDRVALVRDAADIPERAVPLAVVSVGYPTGLEQPKNKFRSDNMHWNKWGE